MPIWFNNSPADKLTIEQVAELLAGTPATNTTKLSITASKITGLTYSVTSSGTDYTKSGDDGALLTSADLFNNSERVSIMLNGVRQNKGTHVIWVSSSSFTIDTPLDNKDEIIILS